MDALQLVEIVRRFWTPYCKLSDPSSPLAFLAALSRSCVPGCKERRIQLRVMVLVLRSTIPATTNEIQVNPVASL
jgi:hypothetical protein